MNSIKTRITLLIVFTLLATTFFWMDYLHISVCRLFHGRTLVSYLGFVMAVLAFYELSVLAFSFRVRRRGGAPSEISMMASLLRFGAGTMIIIVFSHFIGKLVGSWMIVAPFIGLLMGWSLQAPISGLAAWVMINAKRPFRVGDRVMFPSWGLIGDVQETGMMYTVLNQVGGTIGSEDSSGRHILIPNAMLFSNVAINYTPSQTAPFVLDEVVVRITYDSDWQAVENILLDAAAAVTQYIIKQTGQQPYVRSDMYDYGVYMRLRYMTMATDRPRIVHEITRRVFKEFQTNPRVDFAIPYVYSYRMGMQAGQHIEHTNAAPVQNININNIVDAFAGADSPAAEQQIKKMAFKIAEMGLLQPIVVELRPDGASYQIIAGHLRWQACKSLGWKTIPAIVKE